MRKLAERIPLLGRIFRDRGADGRRVAHGEAGIHQVGHRRYVGGMWDEIGTLQFNYLVAQGLRPDHYLLDIGCGSLRGGVHFIRYLDAGHYLGMDKEPLLIERGIHEELGADLYAAKRPRLLVSAEFEVASFGIRPDMAFAHSLFTHLPRDLVEMCLARLRPVIADGGPFFATYFETGGKSANPDSPHDHARFYFSQADMREMGQRTGWTMQYIGAWGHPRGQIMVKYLPSTDA